MWFVLLFQTVFFAEATRKMFWNGREICQNGTHTQSSKAVGFKQNFTLRTTHELDDIATLQFSFDNETVRLNLGPKDTRGSYPEMCVYKGGVSGDVTFPSVGEFLLKYSVATETGTPMEKTCSITIGGKLCMYHEIKKKN